jgi:DNA polymerase III alpha subunit
MLDLEQSTQLKGRVLWYDGSSTVCSMEYLYDRILDNESISGLHVDTVSPEIKKYNTLGKPQAPLTVKHSIAELPKEWQIPESFKKLDLYEFFAESLELEVATGFTDEEISDRIERVRIELDLWHSHNMTELLAALIYAVGKFEDEEIVWGTGRGSSCACYLLYLIGVHDVDSIFYNLDIGEFFRD